MSQRDPQAQRKQREAMRELTHLKNTMDDAEHQGTATDLDLLEIKNKVDAIADEAKQCQSAQLTALAMGILSRLARLTERKMDTIRDSDKQFDEETFRRHILDKFKLDRGQREPGSNFSQTIDMSKLGLIGLKYLRLTPSVDTMHGPALVEFTKRQRVVAHKTTRSQLTVAEAKRVHEEDEEASGSNHATVLECFQKFAEQSAAEQQCDIGDVLIPYLKFIVNPDSFSQTVENLFYVSFLVKAGDLRLTVGDDDLPYLQLQDQEQQAAETSEPQHAFITLTMDQWRQLIEVLLQRMRSNEESGCMWSGSKRVHGKLQDSASQLLFSSPLFVGCYQTGPTCVTPCTEGVLKGLSL
eukprot:m.128918 g.128918  ORF g.128918 m.128918 type:complete len:354 (+) comp13881_c0_seq2:245-1306(+)